MLRLIPASSAVGVPVPVRGKTPGLLQLWQCRTIGKFKYLLASKLRLEKPDTSQRLTAYRRQKLAAIFFSYWLCS
jgi:hypothetical protein